MDPWTIRTRALELALQSLGETSDKDILRRAEAFVEFLNGTSPTPREKINAALDQARVN